MADQLISYSDFVAAQTVATEADLVNANRIVIQTASGQKQAPGDIFAKKSEGTSEIRNISTTATEDDLVSGNYIALDGSAGTKKIAGNAFAKKSDSVSEIRNLINLKYTGYIALDDSNGTGKFQIDNLIGSIAEIYVEGTTNAVAGRLYMYQGKCWRCKENTSGAWDASKFNQAPVSDYVVKHEKNLDKVNESLYYEIEEPKNFDSQIANAYINASGNMVSFPGGVLRVLVLNVTAGEKYIIKGTGQAGIAKCWAVYNTQDTSLMSSSTLLSISSKQLDEEDYELEVTIPEGGLALAASNYTVAGSVTFKKVIEIDKVAETEEKVAALDDVVFYDKISAKTPDDTLTGYWINVSGNVKYYSDNPYLFGCYVINVTAGEKYIIKGTGQAGIAKCWAVYSTDEVASMDGDHRLELSTKNLNEVNYELEVTIPKGAVTLVMSYYRQAGSVVALLKSRGNLSENVAALEGSVRFRYVVSDGKVIVGTKSGNKELVVSLAAGGGNGLFDFRKFGKIDIGAPLSDTGMTQFSSNSSDWFGPFIMFALQNKDGDDIVSSGGDSDGFRMTFTGGAHQYNNLGSGSTPTARLANLAIRVNGEAVTEGSGEASIIEMKWTNYIQGYNTKKADGTGREILKENITLRYNGVEWDAETELVPLEDVGLRRWYGYQFTGIGGGLSVHWKYINGSNRGEDESISGNGTTSAMLSYGGNCNVEMYLDKQVDMGKGTFYAGTVYNSAFMSNNKGYFTIVDDYDPNKNLIQGNNYYLFGKYRIYMP